MAEVTVRRVTLEDYESVMDINREVYSGNDYLPVKYPHFFHENNCRIYALDQDGLLVSFVIFMLSEEGAVVSTMAVRVRPTHQGLGLSVDRNAQLRGALRADVPSVKRELYAIVRHEGTEKKITNSTLHYQWTVIGRTLSIKEQPRDLFDLHQSDVVKLSYNDIVRSLATSGNIPNFLSKYADGFVAYNANWRPTRIEANELKRLFAINTTFVTLARTAYEDAQATIFNSEITALSYCNTGPVSLDCRSDLFYYGSIEHFRSHFIGQLRHLAGIYDGLVSLHICVPSTIDSLEAAAILDNIEQLKCGFVTYINEACIVLGSKDF